MGKIIMRELRLILSDSGAMLILLFAMLIYTIIYSTAYGSEVAQSIDIAVVDGDKTPTSSTLVEGLRSGPNTRVAYEVNSISQAKQLFFERKIYGIVVIPNGLERDLLSSRGVTIGLILDGDHLLLYSKVFEQSVSDALTQAAEVEVGSLVAKGVDDITAVNIAEPVRFSEIILYNSSLGYGSFVMPSIVVVIIQQTLLIGVAMVSMRRRREQQLTWVDAIKRVVARDIVYVAIYLVEFAIIMLTVWQVFGFPMNGNVLNILVLMVLYIFASANLAQSLSHLFKRREAPMMMLLWSSVPILLLAGVSYPREAFPEWLYAIGRLMPSSSAVDGFIRLNSMGAPLSSVKEELLTLLTLGIGYGAVALLCCRLSATSLSSLVIFGRERPERR